MWLCGGVAPPIQEMRSAVVWAVLSCVMCVQLCVYGLRGSIETQDAALWAWSGSSLPVQLLAECTVIIRPHPLDLDLEMGVVRLLAPHLTSLMWLGVVSSVCHAPSLVVP